MIEPEQEFVARSAASGQAGRVSVSIPLPAFVHRPHSEEACAFLAASP
ncbi:hypothetical protein [Mesorhizobium sp.]|nr:hypothetical protein [Mesorhizobium sp.]